MSPPTRRGPAPTGQPSKTFTADQAAQDNVSLVRRCDTVNDLRVAAAFLADGGEIIEWPDDDLGGHALDYARQGWEVFQVSRSKVPMKGSHGHLEATTDFDKIAQWWTKRPRENIGMRPPTNIVVLDIDPRHDGDKAWAELEREHGETPTLMVWSGRDDGGNHRYYFHPGGTLCKNLAPGIDIKSHSGFVVLPPSIHAVTGKPYRWAEPLLPISAMAAGIAALARKPPPEPRRSKPRSDAFTSSADSPADWYCQTRCWGQVLEPHGWHCIAGDGDEDGSRWLHPAATSDTSATIKHGLLFAYTPNTVFEVTGAEDPHGHTKFKAFALLTHRGDQSAAARAVIHMRGGR